MALAAWAFVMLVGPGGAELATWSIEGEGNLDLAVVDALARSQLRARRLGGAIHLRHGSKELLELLDLVGLAGVLDPPGRSHERHGDGDGDDDAPGRSHERHGNGDGDDSPEIP